MRYAADSVFTALAGDILRGVYEPGVALPAERELSERFKVSKVLVRQAIHRLREIGLLEVRQGGATRVLDPAEAHDVRVIELYYKLAPDTPQARALLHDVNEKQFTQGLSLLEVFSRRASKEARTMILLHTASEEEFWTAVARGGGNRILIAETRFWYAAPRPPMPERSAKAKEKFYYELARRLAAGEDAIGYYLAALRPLLAKGKKR
jgi:GntR family transcriptional regulator, transcriptional repressor for pyruvate dehydrogenase complex